MGNKGFECLKAVSGLCETNTNFEISFVISSRDKNIVNDYFEDIRIACLSKMISFQERSGKEITEDCDISFAVSWRWLINKNLEKLVVFHDSLLPKLRGFNPLVTSLIEGYPEIGVTAIKANKEFDKGNILGMKSLKVVYPIKIVEAIELVSHLYADLILEILSKKQFGTLVEIPQDESQATYSLWRDETDYEIDWSLSSERILRTINASGFPYKGASIMLDGRVVRINEASIVDDVEIINRAPGKILFLENQNPIVVCGKGLLKITSAIYEDDASIVNFNKLRIRL